MAYSVAQNNPVTVLHACRDLSGALLTGQAGALASALLDEAGVASANTVTITEIGVTGLYSVAFTPDTVGNWLLSVTNPAPLTADGQTYDYAVQSLQAAAVTASSSLLLTTRARVKERMQITQADFDDLIDSLISEISSMIQDRLGRTIAQQTYTEYYDGTGRSDLWLRQGPLVSVTSVNEVTYSGTSSRSESLTVVNEANRLEGGLRSEGYLGRGFIRMIGSVFTVARRNYKVVYVAGWATLPEALVKVANDWVVAAFNRRLGFGTTDKVIGDANQSFVGLEQADEAVERAIAPYQLMGEVV